MTLWDELKEHTQARIGLHRTGHSVSTEEQLAFQAAHALARDAVHEVWNVDAFEKRLEELGEKPLIAHSGIDDRETYLKFPNLGRVLDDSSRSRFVKYKASHPIDIVFIFTDGLSPRALNSHAISFWKAFKPVLNKAFRYAMVLVPFGRVALSDDIGEALGAKMSVMFVGERPGLSSADSLGIYLTYAPKVENTDSQRNCISNIHPPEGLSYATGVEKLSYLISECMSRKLSGVDIKEESDHLLG